MRKIHIKLTRARVIALGLLIAALAVGAGLAVYSAQRKDQASKQLTVCSEETLKRAEAALRGNDRQTVAKVASEIEKLEGYEKDQNCLYVAINDSLLSADFTTAQQRLEKLKPVYKKEGVSKVFSAAPTSPAELEASLSAMKKVYDEGNKQERETLDRIIESQRVADEARKRN